MLVVDRLTEDVRRLREAAGGILEGGICLLGDDGFLPAGISSPYRYFIDRANGGAPAARELFFDFIKVPEFWEIRADGNRGAVYDMGRRKADIYFTEPAEKRNVQRVEWHMENGRTYKIDYYDRYGLHYATAFLGAEGKVESRSYYSRRHQEVVVEQPQNDTVTLLHEGAVEAFFSSYGQFLAYYMKTKMADNMETPTPDGERHVLWLQDRESLGIWKPETGKTDIWDCILFRQREALEQYRAAGGRRGRVFYGVPRDYRRNRARGEALVLTASDQLEGVEYLAEELPEVRFHIAANTQVSEKLWSLTARENIMVYPQIGARELEDLWERCDFYLDINHYREVFDAIPQAHGRNLAILGFEDTLHGRELTAEEGIFPARDYEGMAQALGDFVGYPEAVGAFLRRQQEKKRQNWEGLLERLARGKTGTQVK